MSEFKKIKNWLRNWIVRRTVGPCNKTKQIVLMKWKVWCGAVVYKSFIVMGMILFCYFEPIMQ